MNVTKALDTTIHYAHTNSKTIAIATGFDRGDGLPGTFIGRCS
jgi:hypothetical protein